jgi:NAD(P)-dependent dehydrogenase (short-subunit alcohol dehydrogenase family)
VKKVEAELGPVDVLVNNAGITRDGRLPQDDARAVVGRDATPTSARCST